MQGHRQHQAEVKNPGQTLVFGRSHRDAAGFEATPLHMLQVAEEGARHI